MFKFKLDAMWVIIFILSGFVALYVIIVFILLFLSFLEYTFKVEIKCVCRGWRLNSNQNIIIPLYFYCYCIRSNRNVQILPINTIPKLQTLKEYNKETNNVLIINPNNVLSIGLPKNN